ncbi:MAG: hypothetical protein ACLT4U_06030 [Blautia obeum]|nr:hypothetical protein [Blautia faecis]
MRRTKMDEIVENMANYICDHICQKPKEITDTEKLEDYCTEECEIGSHICNILNQYNEINDFENSELYKIMTKHRNIVLCKECQYRIHHDTSGFDLCRISTGLSGFLGEGDGCSRGLKVSESDT